MFAAGFVDGESFAVNQTGPAEVMAFGDFNGDGYQDSAMGMPSSNVAGALQAGALRVVYGGRAGMSQQSDLWDQNDFPSSSAELSDRFASALSVGDFNGDRVDDLAIGSPGEDDSAGAVYFLAGAAGDGLQIPLRGLPPLLGTEPGGGFGSALATGNFDSFSGNNLAVGEPDRGAGAVWLFIPTPSGMTQRQHLTPEIATDHWGHRDAKEQTEPIKFGASMAVGDFNNDRLDDLVVGAPHDSTTEVLCEGDGGLLEQGAIVLTGAFSGNWDVYPCEALNVPEAGAVYVYDGDPSGGLSGTWERFTQSPQQENGLFNTVHYGTGPRQDDDNTLRNRAEAYDHFGTNLAVGDFNADGVDDLAIGVPHEDLKHKFVQSSSLFRVVTSTVYYVDAGAVNVVYGDADGLDARANNEFWHQKVSDVEVSWGRAIVTESGLNNPANHHDRFGFAITAGDFGGDGIDDLAIGVPGEDIRHVDAGAIHILQGSQQRLRSPTTQPLTSLRATPGGLFGLALAAGDINADGVVDLATSTLLESAGWNYDFDSWQTAESAESRNAVHFLFGDRYDPDNPGSRLWQTWDEQRGLVNPSDRSPLPGLLMGSGTTDSTAAPATIELEPELAVSTSTTQFNSGLILR